MGFAISDWVAVLLVLKDRRKAFYEPEPQGPQVYPARPAIIFILVLDCSPIRLRLIEFYYLF